MANSYNTQPYIPETPGYYRKVPNTYGAGYELAPYVNSNTPYGVPKPPYIKRTRKTSASVLFDYNDPYEINSFADIILGTFNPQVQHTKLFGLDTPPVLNIIPNTLGLMYRGLVKPVAQGNWGAVGLNTFTNFAETMDVLANPVKGLIIDGQQGLLNSLGYGGRGRVNYDFDTGHWATDIMAEMLVDPLNWVTLFGKGAVVELGKSATERLTKEALGEVGERFVKEVGEEASEKYYKTLAKRATRAYVEGDYKNMSDALYAIAKNMQSKNQLIFKRVPTPDDMLAALRKLSEIGIDDMSLRSLATARAIIKPTEAFEKGLLKSALFSSGPGLGYWFIKDGVVSPIRQYAQSRTLEALKPFLNPNGKLNIAKYDEALLAYKDRTWSLNKVLDLSDKLTQKEFDQIVSRGIWNTYTELDVILKTKIEDIPGLGIDAKLAYITQELNRIYGIDDIQIVQGIFDDLAQRDPANFGRLAERLRSTLDMNTRMEKFTKDQAWKAYQEWQAQHGIDLQKAWDAQDEIKKIFSGPTPAESLTKIEAINKYIQREYPGVESIADLIAKLPDLEQFSKVRDRLIELQKRIEVYDEVAARFAASKTSQGRVVYQKTVEQTISAPQPIQSLYKVLNFEQLMDSSTRIRDSFSQEEFSQVLDNVYNNRVLSFLERYEDAGGDPRVLDDFHDAISEVLENFKDAYPTMKANAKEGFLEFPEIIEKQWDEILDRFNLKPKELTKEVKVQEFILPPPKKVQEIRSALQANMKLHEELYANLETAFKNPKLAHLAEKRLNLGVDISNINTRSVGEIARKLQENVHLNKDVSELVNDWFDQFSVPGYRDAFNEAMQELYDPGIKISQKLESLQTIQRTLEGLQLKIRTDQFRLDKAEVDSALRAIQELLSAFDDVDLSAVQHKALKLVADDVYIVNKLENKYVLDMLMSHEDIQEFISNSININTAVGKFIKELADAGNESAINYLTKVQAYTNYNHFLYMIHNVLGDYIPKNSPYAETITDIILSEVQNYSKVSPKVMMDKFDSMFYYLTEKIELHLNVLNQKRKLNLDSLAKELTPARQELLNSLNSAAHRADFDSVRNALIAEQFLPELQDTDDLVRMFWDIETSSQSKYLSEITQLGWYIPSQGLDSRVNLGIANSLEVQDRTIKALFREEIEAIRKTGREPTRIELRDMYRRVFGEGQNTEIEAILAFTNKLTELQSSGKKVLLAGHNTQGFDIPQMKFTIKKLLSEAHAAGNNELASRLGEALRVFQDYEKIQQIDTLKLIQAKEGFQTLDQDTLDGLYSIFRQFVEAQSNLDSVAPGTIKQSAEKLIQPVDPTLLDDMKEVTEILRRFSDGDTSILESDPARQLLAESASKDIYSAVQEVYAWYKTVKETNTRLGQVAYSKTLFDDSAFMQEFGLNMSQALYTRIGADGAREIVEGTAPYGWKYLIDTALLAEYYYYRPGDVLFAKNAEQLTRFGKWIDSNLKNLKNSSAIRRTSADANQLLSRFLEAIPTKTTIPSWMSQLRTDKDPYTNYAILQALYDYTKNRTDGLENLLYQVAKDEEFPELFDLLKHPEKVTTLGFDERLIQSYVNPRQERAVMSNTPLVKDLENQYKEARKRMQENMDRIKKDFSADQKAQREYEINSYKLGWLDKKLETGTVNIRPDLEYASGYYRAVQNMLDDNLDNNIDPLFTWAQSLGQNNVPSAVAQRRGSGLKDYQRLLEIIQSDEAKFTKPEQIIRRVDQLHEYTDIVARAEMHKWLKSSKEELLSRLVHQSNGLLMFKRSDYMGEEWFTQAYLDFIEQLKDMPVHYINKDEWDYIVLDFTKKITVSDGRYFYGTDLIPAPKLEDLDYEGIINAVFDSEFDNELKKALLQTQKGFVTLTGNYDDLKHVDFKSNIIGSLGQSTSQTFYSNLRKAIPDEIAKLLPMEEQWLASELFSEPTFNHTLLGSTVSRREFYEYTPNDILSVYSNTAQYQAATLKAKSEYINMLFDPDTSINLGFLKDATDAQLLQYFQNNRGFRLAALVEDPKQGFRVVGIDALNLNSIKEARRLNAVVMTGQTYSSALSSINSFRFSNKVLNLWHKYIYLSKAGYLLAPGVVMRNFIDSTAKNFIETEDVTGMVSAYVDSLKLYNKYRQVIKEVRMMDANRKLIPDNVIKYFQGIAGEPALDEAAYRFVHTFFEYGPSGGQVKELADLYKYTGDESVWKSATELITDLMYPNTVVEHISRFAEYLWAVKSGMTETDAFALISKTHFDYALKSDFGRMMELVIPFYTFTIENFRYWAEAVDAHPWLMSVFRDMMTPIWNFDEQNHDELSRNRSLQYQLLSGNIPLTDTGMTLKVNPSIMDVANTITDPLGTLQSKIFSPIQSGFSFVANTAAPTLPEFWKDLFNVKDEIPGTIETSTSLIPILGTLRQRYLEQGSKYYARTGNVLNKVAPDIFGATQRWTQYPQKPKFRYEKVPFDTTFSSSGFRRYPRYKKSFHRRAYYKNTYHRPYYESFYSKHYSRSTGTNKFKLRMIPLKSTMLKYRIRDMHHYYNHY